MNILVVIPSFYPAVVYGGPIFSSLYTCKELSKYSDVNLKVVTTNANMDSRLNVATNTWLNQGYGFLIKYYHDTIINKFSFKLTCKIWKDIKESDVIHLQSIFNSPTPITLIYSLLLNKKVILSPRGSLGIWCVNNGSKFKKLWIKAFIKPFLKNIVWHATSEQEKMKFYIFLKILL